MSGFNFEISKLLEVTDCNLVRECSDSKIYIVTNASKKRCCIVKELLTPKRIQNMRKEIVVCSRIKEQYPDFPCEIPQETELERFYIQNYLPGDHYLNIEFSSIEKIEIASQLVDILIKLHNVTVKEEQQISTTEWVVLLIKTIKESLQIIKVLKIVDEEKLHLLSKWMIDTLDCCHIRCPMTYVHNDLNKENIIIDKSSDKLVVSLIDFEKTIVGDPLKDISKLIWLFRADSEFGDIFWKLYCERVGTQDINLLKVYWCLDILGHVERYNELIKLDNWDRYLNEEIEILNEVIQQDYRIW